jgi:murein DD-endopeptidase MepM/ murein hydrolase activator NlpD
MRTRQLLPVVLLLMLPASASAQTGGVAAPDPADRAGGGGAQFGQPVKKASKRPRPEPPLTPSEFSAGPALLQPGGAPVTFTYRIDGPARRVRLRIDVLRASDMSLAKRIRLGWKPTRERREHRWKVAEGELPPGEYVARLHASDGFGHTLQRTARASGRSSLSVAAPVAPVRIASGNFPVQGPFSFGGDSARFGDDRGSHAHQGQDIMATEGTPVVTPRAGRVRWKAFQASGAGHYLVIRGDDSRDYVFMHLVEGSITVDKEEQVTAGQQVGLVGNTGRSQGAHLHFEIWPCGWYVKGCEPIDPRPELDAWAAAAGVKPS